MLDNDNRIVIDAFTNLNEKGNTLLTGDDGAMVAWLRCGKVGKSTNVYLEVSYVPTNSPGLHVGGTWTSNKALRAHARKACKGWYCVRWGIDSKPPVDKNGDIK
jgi:hypothetical protein